MLVRKMFCNLASRWSHKTRNKSPASTGCWGEECTLQGRSNPFASLSLLCVPKLLGTAEEAASPEHLGVCYV